MMRYTSMILVLTLAGKCNARQDKIKHVVVLMEENRSFDHMFGFYKGVNGLKGDESNPFNTSDPDSKRVTVGNTSPYVGPFDPDHGTPATTLKIFGEAGVAAGSKVASMDGFIEFEAHHHADPSSVMNMFTPDRLPVMSTLADEFMLFDRFFCSHPGPTWPNRLYQLMATSEGDTETSKWDPNTVLYTNKTIFDQVDEAGLDWRFYYADAPLEMVMLKKLLDNPLRIHGWERFLRDAREGSLPEFSWLNPRWFVNTTTGAGASDQHPDHDVRQGEGLMKEVYEALRASPAWASTLFIITYDEHGGFYDHVPTPLHGVPAPDNSTSFPDKDFHFDRLGIRVPMLAISPWVAKGQVVSAPTTGPTNTSEYEATSILSTMKNLFDFPKFLTKRDAWAGTFDHLLLDTPRTDCPTTLPAAPKVLPSAADIDRESNAPLNDLQQDIVKAFARVGGPHNPLTSAENLPRVQGEGGAWVQRVTEAIMRGQHAFADMPPSLHQA